MLKSTGCDYFNFNIQMGVPQVQLIVYTDVCLLESQFLKQNGAYVNETKWRFFDSWKDQMKAG